MQDFATIVQYFREFNGDFREITYFAKIFAFIVAKFHEIRNNFIQISCFAKLSNCCFAATLTPFHFNIEEESERREGTGGGCWLGDGITRDLAPG